MVLIVEDERDLVKTLEYNLQREGFRTCSALTGLDGLQTALKEPVPDLILLDLMLPDISGIEVCRRLKQNETTRGVPVVMLTAKGDEIDRVVGFEVGADDYVVKPFSVRELLLRIRAILRRVQPEEKHDEKLKFGNLQVDPLSHRVWVDEKEIRLTALEFRLLKTLMARKGRVQSRESLLSTVWGIDADVTTRTVDTHVTRLREKLGSAGVYIETLRGVGYRFSSQTDGAQA